MPKEAIFTVKLEAELRDAFKVEAERTHLSASQLVRDFMREFVGRQRDRRKHDAWFRANVKEALADPRPVLGHEAVMAETRAIIDRIARS